jgi:hypothetical protein
VNEQQHHIEDIRSDYLSAKPRALSALSGAVDRIRKTFPRYGSFLMEFIQNADDAGSSWLKAELYPDKLVVSNDGRSFVRANVDSICGIGQSSKTPKDYIGYLGVGFKSVFLVSDAPEVHSGGYDFRFSEKAWEDPRRVPWQVIPAWIGDTENHPGDSDDRGAVFVLPFRHEDDAARVANEFDQKHINSRILLFLRSVQKLELVNRIQEPATHRVIERVPAQTTSDYSITKVTETRSGTVSDATSWVVFRSTADVPRAIREDPMTLEWDRASVETREVVAAFKLSNEGTLIREPRGTAHIGVFSFLPLTEIESGLNFLIQADLLTMPGRGELARDSKWNEWMADEVLKLVLERCIPTFLADEGWRMRLTDVLWSSGQGHELFSKRIKDPLNSYLQNHDVLVDVNGQLGKAPDMVALSDEVWEVVGGIDPVAVFGAQRIMHKDCRVPAGLQTGRTYEALDDFLRTDAGLKLLQERAKRADIGWFRDLYRRLTDIYTPLHFYGKHYQYNVAHNEFWAGFRESRAPMILTSEGGTATIRSAWLNPNRVSIPPELKPAFPVVHPELAVSEEFGLLRRKFGDSVLRDLTQADIQGALADREALALNADRWQGMSQAERIARTQDLQRLWCSHRMSLEQYDFVTLKACDGSWRNPADLVFSRGYGPSHSLEDLVNRGLYDQPVQFVATDYIDGFDSEQDLRSWRDFLKKLGVDAVLDDEEGKKKAIVQRIGVLAAMKYERDIAGREPKELGESEGKLKGYDIESCGTDGVVLRYIEAKGGSRASFDWWLSVHEVSVMHSKDKADKYYIYGVANALTAPEVHVVKGTSIPEDEVKMSVPPKTWTKLAEDRREM